MATSTKPYLVRALYDWCVDNGCTPHVAVWVNQYTQVPMQFVKDDEIVLNIGPTACKGLTIDNEWIHFEARFGGKAEEIWIPIGHVISIFARENSNGMGFDVEAYEPDQAEETAALQVLKPAENKVVAEEAVEIPVTPAASKSNFLKIVK